MASISPPPPHNFTLSSSKFLSSYALKGPTSPSSSPHFPSTSPYQTHTICRCNNSDSPSPSDPSAPRQWHSALQDLVQTAIKTFDSLMNPWKSDSKEALHSNDGLHTENDAKEELGGIKDDRDWDWDRWRKHFQEVDEQERLLAVLKSQLSRAIRAEDYQYAARTKVAIAALSTNDAVGRVGSYLNKAIEEERYHDAAFIRDEAGAGLVGWWSGIPKSVKDPRGLIIRITAEHGRYVARSYSPRQLTTATSGIPLFEIFLKVNEKGEYKQQAVYLKWGGAFQVSSADSSKVSDGPSLLSSSDPIEDKGELFVSSSEDVEDVDDKDEDSDLALGLNGFQNLMRDVIPGVKVKILKMTTPGKVDKDLISKVIEQIIEEEEEEEEEGEGEGGEEDVGNGSGEEDKNGDFDILDAENRIQDEDQLREAINLDSDPGIIENEVHHNGIAVKVVVGGLVQKLSGRVPSEDFIRVPAKIDKKDRLTFSFSIEEDDNKQDSEGKKRSPASKRSKLQNDSGIEHIMVDLAKFVGREKIPLKVFKEVGELIKLTLSQAQNHEPLVGTTNFNRIEINASSDPLNGLYIGAHGLYTSEVIHLKRRFGRWKEDREGQETSNIEFYEYVEAFKITGDPYVPAGQVAFRAKVGRRYQIPHKGIIPEEFGVIARYKGQGRLAEPGFQNPRWVDGELVILDGKIGKSYENEAIVACSSGSAPNSTACVSRKEKPPVEIP